MFQAEELLIANLGSPFLVRARGSCEHPGHVLTAGRCRPTDFLQERQLTTR
jgi:hypothetical protein